MSMEQPTFNPRDEKYEKVADLPTKEQGNFVDVEGGFITKEAKDYDDLFQRLANNENKGFSNTVKHLLGKEKVSKESLIEQNAFNLNKSEKSLEEKEELRKYEELKWAEFERVQDVEFETNNTHIGLSVIKFETDEGKFELYLGSLVKRGIVTKQNLVEMFESKLESDYTISFSPYIKLLPEGTEKLGQVIGKKITSIE